MLSQLATYMIEEKLMQVKALKAATYKGKKILVDKEENTREDILKN